MVEKFSPRSQIRHWKLSIEAGYTPAELEEFIAKAKRNDWRVRAEAMELFVESA